jgi:transcriptional regulator with XRE-family HTH domain
MTITPDQARAGRQLLAWTQAQLAVEARISPATVSQFEGGKYRPSLGILSAMQSALEESGVEFTNGGEPGVKLRKAK